MIQRLRKRMIVTFMLFITVLLIVLTTMITLIPINHIEANKKDILLRAIARYIGYSLKVEQEDIKYKDVGLEPVSDNLLIIKSNRDGELINWIGNRTDLYSNSEIKVLIDRIQEKESNFGIVDGYYFAKRRMSQGRYVYGLIDNNSFFDAILSSLVLIIIFAVISWYVCLCITIFSVEKMLKPVKEGIQKQKQFISDAGHELKTPVAVITANANVLQREIGPIKWLDYIVNEAQIMQRLIQSLMSLAEIEDPDNVLEFEEFELGHLVMGATLPYESLAFEKGTIMEWDIDDNTQFYGNKERMSQMISALVNNAVTYCNENGRIKIGLKRKKRELELTVYNTGIGIPIQNREQIFQRFFRGDASRNRNGGNYGLGLPIVQSIVHEHHGRINVSGTYQEDVCFTVHLPYQNIQK